MCRFPILAIVVTFLASGTARAWPPRLDSYGDPLPAGAVARLGTIRWRHDSVIRSVQYSADGKTLFTDGEDDTVRAWDARTGLELARFPGLARCWKLRVSSDGQVLAGVRHNEVLLLNRKTGKEPRSISIAHVGGFALSPNGRMLAVGSPGAVREKQDELTLFDTANGKELFSLPGHRGGVNALQFMSDGKTLISTGIDRRIRFWDCGTRQEVRPDETAFQHRSDIEGLALSANGKLLASIAWNVHLWEPTTGKLLRQLQGHRGSVNGVSVSPDGQYVASCGWDDFRMWDAASGKELWKMELLKISTPATSSAFSPDGKVLAVADGALLLCDVKSGKRLNVREAHEGHIAGLAFSPDGKRLVSSGYDPGIRVWDVQTQKLLQVMERPGVDHSMVFSPNGKLLAGPGEVGFRGLTQSVVLWDMENLGVKTKLLVPHREVGMGFGGMGSQFHMLGLRFTTDGKKLTGRDFFGLYTWDVASGKPEPLRYHRGPKGEFELLAPDGRMEAQVTSTGWDRIWRQESVDNRVRPGTTFPIEQSVTIRDTRTGLDLARMVEKVQFVQGDQEWCRAPRVLGVFREAGGGNFSRDGRLLLTHVADDLQLRELASGKTLWNRKHPGVEAVWFSSDDSLIGVSATDGRISMLDAATGAERIKNLAVERHHLHTVSPDGRRLATAHGNQTILLWDLTAYSKSSPAVKPSPPAELDILWAELKNEDAVKAYAAMRRLALAPEGVAFVARRLKPNGDSGEDHVVKVIQELNSQHFANREAASHELKQMGAAVRPALAAVLSNKPTLEVRRRIEALLADEKPPDRLVAAGEPLRRYRAVQVVEWAGTPEARALLATLAEGPDHSAVAREARTALTRQKPR